VTILDTQVIELQDRVGLLTITSAGYQDIRHRFLEVYRRDILENVGKQGRKKFNKGNEAAHKGDAVADADLYVSHGRMDEIIFINLYGMTPNQVMNLNKNGDNKSISILNAGATWRAKGSDNIPPDVAAGFDTFIQQLNFNFGKNPTDSTTCLGKAYYTFWAAHNRYN